MVAMRRKVVCQMSASFIGACKHLLVYFCAACFCSSFILSLSTPLLFFVALFVAFSLASVCRCFILFYILPTSTKQTVAFFLLLTVHGRLAA